MVEEVAATFEEVEVLDHPLEDTEGLVEAQMGFVGVVVGAWVVVVAGEGQDPWEEPSVQSLGTV